MLGSALPVGAGLSHPLTSWVQVEKPFGGRKTPDTVHILNSPGSTTMVQ